MKSSNSNTKPHNTQPGLRSTGGERKKGNQIKLNEDLHENPNKGILMKVEKTNRRK